MFDDFVRREFERLVVSFRRLAVAAPLLGAPLALPACTCPDVDVEYLLRTPDAETQALITACEDPAKRDCLPLCQRLSGAGADGADGASAGASAADDITHCELHRSAEGYADVHIRAKSVCIGGRRPEGLALALTSAGASGAGALFAELAELEAASVPAFGRLARELGASGAPPALVAEARRAAAD